MADYLYGIHPVREGLCGRRRPLELFVDEGAIRERIEELLALARAKEVPVRRRKRQDLDRLVGHAHHQGVVLRTEAFPYVSFEQLLTDWQATGEPGFFLVLDGITDPHNLGAILRNADAAGCRGVIMPKDRSCGVTNVVDKVSAGAVEHLPICQVTNLARAIRQLKSAGIWVYGLARVEGATSLYASDLRGNLALVVGSEGEGLRLQTRKMCDLLLEIPMAGGLASLNAASAAAVALFEAVRQQRH